MWAKGVIDVGDSLALLRDVVYLNGRNFCLRGGNEHGNLTRSARSRSSQCCPTCYATLETQLLNVSVGCEGKYNHRCKKEGLETPGHVIAFVEARVDSGSFSYTSAVFAFFHHKTVCR